MASGGGNVEVPLRQSTLQLLDSRTTQIFPASGDTVDVINDPWWWHAGDNAEGERLSALSAVNAISYTLIYTNDLDTAGSGACSAGGEVPLALSVDDEIVATTTITPGIPETVDIIASFDHVSGMTHTLRLEETAQVASGCGHIHVPLDVSPFRLIDTWRSRHFPVPGDDVPGDLDWGTVGDVGAGQRQPGADEINAAVYNLRLGSNTLTLGSAVTLSLKVNGVQVGAIPVGFGDMSANHTFNFAPITSTLYTVTLETASKSGSGQITVPYDRSALRLVNTLNSRFFPATGDLVSAPLNHWDESPDLAIGVRRPAGLTQVSALEYQLRAVTNTLTGTLWLRFEINATPVGNFSLAPGELLTRTVLNFAPITSPSGIYTITLRALNPPAGGAAIIPLDRSRLTLGDPAHAATFPATGDTVDEGSNPGWDQAGDFAAGLRTPGLAAVNHLEYTLYTLPNSLTCTLTTTLKLNGTPVVTMPIVSGAISYPVSADFASVPAVGGRYTVTLVAQNTVACGDTHVPLNVSPLGLSYVTTPTAGFTASPLSGYVPLTVTFTATSTGIAGPSYAWAFGDSGTGSGKIAAHAYTLAGVYPVTLTVSGLGGPVTLTRPAYVTVNALVSPTVSFTGTPTSGSAPLMVVFTSTTTGPVSGRLWDFGDGYTSTAIAPSHIYTASGVYTVSLAVNGPGGSANQTQPACISVGAPSAPGADFSGSPTSGTAPLTVTFTSVVTGPVIAYAWDFGDSGRSAAADPAHVYANAGTYTVVFTATNAAGSTPVSRTNYVVVSPPPAPVVSFTATPITGNVPLNVTFTSFVTGTVLTYTWDFGDGGGSTAHNPIHGYIQPGVYTVVFTATGPGGSGSATRVDYVTVYFRVYLPLVLRDY